VFEVNGVVEAVTGTSLNFRGSWSAASTYHLGDAVTDQGGIAGVGISAWVSVTTNVNSEPSLSNANWLLLAEGGNNGGTGATGATGATGPGYTATSTTSLTIGTGSQTLTTQAGLAYSVGARVRISYTTTPTDYMEGLCTSYSGTTLIVNVDTVGGSGTFASWNINLAGNVGATGATGPTGPSSVEVNGSAALTPANLNGTTPAAPAGGANVIFQASGANVSGYLNVYAPTDTPHTVPGLEVWLAADKITGISNGGNVTSWPDYGLSAGGPHASAQWSSAAPTYQTNVINSLPTVRFGGTGWFKHWISSWAHSELTFAMVMRASSLSNTYSAILTAAWIAQPSSGAAVTTNWGGYFIRSTGKTALYWDVQAVNGGSTTQTSYDGTGSATISSGTFYVISGIIGPQAVSTRVALASDGSIASLQNTNLVSSPAVAIGQDYGNSSRVLVGDIAELLIYQHALSTSELSTVENYLKTKYGL
jgi:hypothetical protein